MTKRSFSTTVLLLMFSANPLHAQPQSNDLTRQVASGASSLVEEIPWNKKTSSDYKISDRITPRTAVAIKLSHFNFLRFEPVYSIDAQEIPGYRDLEKLWTQVLSAPGGKVGKEHLGAIQPEFLVRMEAWRSQLTTARQNLATYLDAVPKTVALSDAELADIVKNRKGAIASAGDIESLRKDVEALIFKQFARAADTGVTFSQSGNPKNPGGKISVATNPPERVAISTSPIAEAYYAQQLYDAELVHHRELLDKIQSFTQLAGYTIEGRTRNLDAQKSGTIVVVSISVKALSDGAEEVKAASDAGVTTVRYMVNSTLPLVFHVGPAYTNIEDFDIATVQKLGQGDVFQQIAKNKDGGDLVAYMTYMFTPITEQQTGFGLTLGTGVKDIGKRLYVGLTGRFTERLLLTGGALSQEVKQGENAIVASGDLYESLKNVRKWGFFGAFSFTPF